MAVTQNTYTGDGSTVLFSFTFPYLETTDIKVSLDGVDTTEYSLANATTIEFNTAPVSGAAVRIYRVTDDSQLAAQFYPGSSIRSQDLNENFTQSLYVAQESTNRSIQAELRVDEAITASDQAISIANATTATAAQAVSTAEQAVSTAESAVTTAQSAVSTAEQAVSTSTAIAQSAVTTANQAVATSNSALTTAASAVTTANSAVAAISNSAVFAPIADIASIPSNPTDLQSIQVEDSTGIESFSPLLGMKVGFVGDPGLSVRIQYQQQLNTWVWFGYLANDPEERYSDNPIIVTPQTVTKSFVIDPDSNAAFMGPTVALDQSTVIEVGANSILSII